MERSNAKLDSFVTVLSSRSNHHRREELNKRRVTRQKREKACPNIYGYPRFFNIFGDSLNRYIRITEPFFALHCAVSQINVNWWNLIFPLPVFQRWWCEWMKKLISICDSFKVHWFRMNCCLKLLGMIFSMSRNYFMQASWKWFSCRIFDFEKQRQRNVVVIKLELSKA